MFVSLTQFAYLQAKNRNGSPSQPKNYRPPPTPYSPRCVSPILGTILNIATLSVDRAVISAITHHPLGRRLPSKGTAEPNLVAIHSPIHRFTAGRAAPIRVRGILTGAGDCRWKNPCLLKSSTEGLLSCRMMLASLLRHWVLRILLVLINCRVARRIFPTSLRLSPCSHFHRICVNGWLNLHCLVTTAWRLITRPLRPSNRHIHSLLNKPFRAWLFNPIRSTHRL